MKKEMFLVCVNGVLLFAPKELSGFTFCKRDSSQVDYYAYNEDELRLYVQFKNAGAYEYWDLPLSALQVLKQPDTSVGSWLNTFVKVPKIPFAKSEHQIVVADLNEVAKEFNKMLAFSKLTI